MAADHLTDRLESVWERSDRVFDLLHDDALMVRPIALRHPFLFYLGHLPAFGWNQLGAGALGRPPVDAGFDDLFERGIDPLDEDAVGEAPSWPDRDQVVAYRDRVRDSIRAALPEVAERSDSALLERERIVEVVAEHEEMHHETLMYMLQRLPPELLVAPEGVSEPSAPGGEEAAVRRAIPAGQAVIGARWEQLRFGWDNEFPAAELPVEAFEIDDRPVSIARFRAFVDDGGYERAELWEPGAWAWREGHGLHAPIDWTQTDGRWTCRWLFGHVPLDAVGGWPVRVSHAEANAYARWAGGRLPTEAELHRAAYGRPDGGQNPYPWGDAEPTAEHGNFDFAHFHPVAVGSRPAGTSAFGVGELVGNGWEWSATPFAPLPGFRAWIDSYPGYSADFFDEKHYVIFGGAWPTAAGLLRPSFRNWFQGHYPYVFAGFRLAS